MPVLYVKQKQKLTGAGIRYNDPGGYMGFQFNGDPEGSTWVSVNQNRTPGNGIM